MKDKMRVGNLELCHLPDLGIYDLPVRIDTGAKTSSLHVDHVKRFSRDGKPWLSFDIHPDIHQVDDIIRCESPVFDVRKVKSSNGLAEERYVIKTHLAMGGDSWLINLTLADRSEMSYLMLLGRQGMGDKMLVDPAKTFLLSSTA